MKTNILLLLFFIIALSNMAQNTIVIDKYTQEIENERSEKNIEFKTADNSPIEKSKVDEFSGLNYFEPEIAWRITADLERFDHPDTIQMKTTTERLPLYLVFGKASFVIQDTLYQLTVFQNVGLMSKPGFEDYLFVPFTDRTSNEESYGGGRYIDARYTDDDKLIIDFNRAYNPYCLYNKKYSCPVPPYENFINKRITAGEKKYNH